MHIPASMLNGSVCSVTLAVGAASLGVVAFAARKSAIKPSPARFAAVTALIFALQMLNYPVQYGTSGHLVGAMLAVALLGVPFAILSISAVLAVQAFFFGDGGVNALGANIINMAFIGAGLLGFAFQKAIKAGVPRTAALAGASFLSVLAGAAACSIGVAVSGAVEFGLVMPAMLSVHVLIGLGEALVTVAAFTILRCAEKQWGSHENVCAVAAGALAFVAAVGSPFASGFPDGLEWVAETLAFTAFNGLEIAALFPDYQATFINNPWLSTLIAGCIGSGIVFACTYAVGRMLQTTQTKAV